MIRVTFASEIFGKGTLWEGCDDQIDNIGNIPARLLAKRVVEDGRTRQSGMWKVEKVLGEVVVGPMLPAQQKIFEFGKWCMGQTRDNGGQNIDGGDAQDKMLELGLLVSVEVTEPCGEYCWCAGWDAFPQQCLRYPDDVREAIVFHVES